MFYYKSKLIDIFLQKILAILTKKELKRIEAKILQTLSQTLFIDNRPQGFQALI